MRKCAVTSTEAGTRLRDPDKEAWANLPRNRAGGRFGGGERTRL
jgi:hypothetical protein